MNTKSMTNQDWIIVGITTLFCALVFNIVTLFGITLVAIYYTLITFLVKNTAGKKKNESKK